MKSEMLQSVGRSSAKPNLAFKSPHNITSPSTESLLTISCRTSKLVSESVVLLLLLLAGGMYALITNRGVLLIVLTLTMMKFIERVSLASTDGLNLVICEQSGSLTRVVTPPPLLEVRRSLKEVKPGIVISEPVS